MSKLEDMKKAREAETLLATQLGRVTEQALKKGADPSIVNTLLGAAMVDVEGGE